MSALEYNKNRHDEGSTILIQGSVGVEQDGLWGPITIGAVEEWQRQHGLTADGMVGPDTEQLMFTSELAYDCVVVGGADQTGPFECVNWRASNVLNLRNAKRKSQVTELIIHEPATKRSSKDDECWETVQRVLDGRDLGVHFQIAASGVVYQHSDPMNDVGWHLPEHNGQGIGLELVNPYEPKNLRDDDPWKLVIDAPWAHGNSYVVPTVEQCESLAALIWWLIGVFVIENKYHGLIDGRYYLDRLPNAPLNDDGVKYWPGSPGIWAHQHVGKHSDGAFPLLVAMLINENGMSPKDAHRVCVEHCAGVKSWVLLDDLTGGQ